MSCQSSNTVKDGKRKGRQRYKCHECNRTFTTKKQPHRRQNKLWNHYSNHKQTYNQIARVEERSLWWVQKQIDQREVSYPSYTPGKTILIIDTTYFGMLGVMVFRCWNRKKNLLWYCFTGKERTIRYKEGIAALKQQGWIIEAIVCDGKPLRSFPTIPTQMCQFHQIKIVMTCITKNPRLPASRELKAIVLLLPKTDEASFWGWLQQWNAKWHVFLEEQTIDRETSRLGFKFEMHKKE